MPWSKLIGDVTAWGVGKIVEARGGTKEQKERAEIATLKTAQIVARETLDLPGSMLLGLEIAARESKSKEAQKLASNVSKLNAVTNMAISVLTGDAAGTISSAHDVIHHAAELAKEAIHGGHSPNT